MMRLISYVICIAATVCVVSCGGASIGSSGVSNSSLAVPNQISIVPAN